MSWNTALPLIIGLSLVAGGLVLYWRDRVLFDRLAQAAFLFAQKELGSVDGQDLMSNAVLKLIDLLPGYMRALLERYAAYKKITLHDLTHQLAQSVYDRLIVPLKPVQP